MHDSSTVPIRRPGTRVAVLLASLVLAGALLVTVRPVTGGAGDGRGAPSDARLPTGEDEPCSGEAYRQFDFWRGSWEVHAGGRLAGHNEIRAVAGGCGLEESWSGAGGSDGTSLNYYDPSDGRWHQLWVGSGGLILHLSGGLEEGEMVLSGERTADGEPIRDRIRWSPLENGEVRQLWEVSRDGGETWTPAFDGRYRPR